MSILSPYAARIARRTLVLSCGNLMGSYLRICDADAVAWESFDEGALIEYLRSGAQALEERIHQIADPKQTFNESVTKELFFMLESLLYVRNLLIESSGPTKVAGSEQ